MKIIKKAGVLVALSATLSAGMCATATDFFMDAVVSGGERLPEARKEFNYADNEQFERQLYSSLNNRPAKFNDVHVAFVGGERELPTRTLKWVGFVKASQGKVFVCETNTAEGFFDFKWLLKVVRVATKLYPAKDYHMIIEQNSREQQLDGIRFFDRITGNWSNIQREYNGCKERTLIDGLL